MNLSGSAANTPFLISIIIGFHNEDFIAGWTLDCVQRMRAFAETKGFQSELICVLDRADPVTTRIVQTHPCLGPTDQAIHVNNGDAATSRNDAIALAQGVFVATLDGDDYYSENWLAAAAQAAQDEKEPAIFHPDYVVSFGQLHLFSRPTDMRQDQYDLLSCLKTHHWVSTSFGKREVFSKHPFQSTHVRSTGFGYEDWEWNLRLVAAGYLHLKVADTALFYRRKRQSVLVVESGHNAVIRPNPFFDAEFQRRLLPASE